MSDISKIQIIHDLKESFTITDETYSSLISQIENEEFKENIDRFFRGYKFEDLYAFSQSALPWVKLVHGLQQNQLPLSSKETYQVPDYLCIFESSQNQEYPIFIEVKSVKGDKKSLELMKRQVVALNEYANKLQSPLIFAIFWENYGIWTHVPIDVFEEKEKKYKITLVDAFKADVSAVFGDISFIVAEPIFRKTIYGISEEASANHEKFGSVIQDYLSADGANYFEISQVESAVIDSTIKMKKTSETKNGNITTVIEKSEGHYILKLDNIMNRHLAVFGVEPTHEYYDFSRRAIIDLMKKLPVKISYAIPAIAKDLTAAIYQKAFSNSFVWDNYQSTHSESDGKKSE